MEVSLSVVPEDLFNVNGGGGRPGVNRRHTFTSTKHRNRVPKNRTIPESGLTREKPICGRQLVRRKGGAVREVCCLLQPWVSMQYRHQGGHVCKRTYPNIRVRCACPTLTHISDFLARRTRPCGTLHACLIFIALTLRALGKKSHCVNTQHYTLLQCCGPCGVWT